MSWWFCLWLCLVLSAMGGLCRGQPRALRGGLAALFAFIFVYEGSYAAIFPRGEGPLTLNRAAALMYYFAAFWFGPALWRLNDRRHERLEKRRRSDRVE